MERKQRESDAACNVGEVEPDLDAAEVRTFRTDGSRDASTYVAWRANEFCKLGMDTTEFGYFIHAGGVNFFLRVEAGTHGPFVEEMEERTGFDQANGFCVGKKVERNFGRDAAIKELIFGRPCFLHGAIVDFASSRILLQELGSNVVRFASVGEREKRSRASDHAEALVLRIGCMRDFFCKGVIGVLQGAHLRGVDADIECFQAVEVLRRI